MHRNDNGRCSFFQMGVVELLWCLLLLFHHVNNDWIWRLCGPSKGQLSPNQARVRHLLPSLYPLWTLRGVRCHQPPCLEIPHPEHWRWKKRWSRSSPYSRWKGKSRRRRHYREGRVHYFGGWWNGWWHGGRRNRQSRHSISLLVYLLRYFFLSPIDQEEECIYWRDKEERTYLEAYVLIFIIFPRLERIVIDGQQQPLSKL